MKTTKNFQEIMEAYINMHIDGSFNIEIGTNVAMKSGGKNIYGKVIGKEKVMGEPGVEVKWDSGTKGRFKMSDFSSLSMDKKADYIISESVEQIDEAKSMFSQTDRELFAKMTPEEKKERYQHILKLTKHSDSQIRNFAKYAAKEFKQKYMNEAVKESFVTENFKRGDIIEVPGSGNTEHKAVMLSSSTAVYLDDEYGDVEMVPSSAIKKSEKSNMDNEYELLEKYDRIEKTRTQLAEQFAKMTMERNFARSTGNPWTFRNEKEREYTRLKLQLEKLESDT